MPDTLEMSASIAPRLAKAVDTNVGSSARQMTPTIDDEEREAWENLIDNTLIDWGRDPEVLEDDGVTPPSVETIKHAYEIAAALRRVNFPAPTRIVPTGDGGIAFEVDAGSDFVSVEIGDNGTVEYLRFSGSKLVERYEVSIPTNIK